MYNHKLNLFRDYPFSDKKDIPIDDIFLVLPIGTSFCSITGCKKNHIKITTNTIEEWVIVDQLVNNTKYGTILLDEYINVEKTFINTLIETRWVVEPDGLNNIYINGERIQSVGWDNNTTSEPQYIRELVCQNGTVCGNDITIYGEHIINVSGTDFSTSIDDVRCPIKIKESAKGDKGETGDKGDAGSDGEHIFQYLSDPDSWVEPCSSVDQYNVEVCSIPIPEEPYEDGGILDPPDPIDGAIDGGGVSIDKIDGAISPIGSVITVYEEWDTEFKYPIEGFSGECLAVRIDGIISLKEANNVDLVLDWFGTQTTISVGSDILEISDYEYPQVGIGFSGYCKYYKADSDEYFYYPIITADIVPEQFRYSLVTETGGKHYYFNTGVKAFAKYKG